MNLQRNPNITTKLLPDGHVVLFCAKTEWAYVVNPIGAIIWELCDGQLSDAEILRELQGLIPGASVQSLSQEMSSFVQEMVKSGLLSNSQPVPS